jgi:hypothetical protein
VGCKALGLAATKASGVMSTAMFANPVVCPGAIFCTREGCRETFVPANRRQRFCSDRCRAAAHYLPLKRAKQERKNARLRALNRDRSLGFDGRYGGPANLSYIGEEQSRGPNTTA